MSTKTDQNPFDWKGWESSVLPVLEDHSEMKLDLLRDYLVLYLEIVLKNSHGKEIQEITLIDGFAGGGIYENERFGSPITILKAVEEAEATINLTREKKMRIVPTCFFVEKEPNAFACLEATLKAQGYGPKIGQSIHLRRDKFENCVSEIISNINNRHKRGGNRTIFFLDQCGWVKISAATVKRLATELHQRPEFIINFAIDWLVDFLSEKTQTNTKASLTELGLENHVDLPEMLKLRNELGGAWEHAVEAHIGEAFHKATGIKYFSPFYIEPHNNHRGYWLLHLAQSARARSAMTQIHWSKANRSKHYGHLGYDMLSYKPSYDQTTFIKGMAFDEISRVKCAEVLTGDFARIIRDEHKEGLTFKNFIDKTSNKIMASSPMVQDVIWQLCQTSDFEARSPSGRTKKTMNFAPGDIIIPRQQFLINGIGAPLSRSSA